MSSHETLSILVMLNNYFHDLAVGILFANVLLSLFLLRFLEQHASGNETVRARFIRVSSRITWASLAFIVVGGIIRTATYRSFEWAEAAGKGQVAALILKHIILVGCTVAGITFQVRMSRKYKDSVKSGAPGKIEEAV